ncbi:heat shock factor-binding protein 1-like [Halichondria panicea]|uniref:heat shock factor-binding protein 1-like n=1 Tax=Halichondria panicea TaxID=6063 RepID=UPI00312BB732
MSSQEPQPDTNQTEGQEGQDPEQLTKFVEELLSNMQGKFQQMSEQIIGRLDEMGKRVEDLEKNIEDLMQQVDTKDDAKK